MKLVVGLGNPGSEYYHTKHNVGFMVVDEIAKKLNIELNKEKFKGIFYKNSDFIIAKPLTFMNKSGEFVQQIIKYFNISVNDVFVIYDDLDFPIGKAVVKVSGSANGQKGMNDIIEKLQTKDIKRVRIGIGREADVDIASYVLSPFKAEDEEKIALVVSKVADTVMTYLYNDIKVALDEYSKAKQKH